MSKPYPRAYLEPLAIVETERRPHPKGLKLVDLSLNECPEPPPMAVLSVIQSRAENGNKYGDPFSADLRRKLAKTYNLDPASIICGNGSEDLVDLFARAFLRPGDDILISEHGFYQFRLIAHRLGANVVCAPENGHTADVDNILNAITPRTKIIYLALPNNPTGTMPAEAEIHRLIENLPTHVVLVADLAYGEFLGFGFCQRLHSRVPHLPNLIVTRTFSKAFSLAAYRLGWCNVPLAMAPVINTLRAIGNVNGLAQVAGIAALDHLDVVEQRVEGLLGEMQRVREGLSQAGFIVEETLTNFVMVRLPDDDPRSIDDWAAHLYSAGAIVVRRVREPGLHHFARLCMGTPEQNSLLLRLSAEFMAQNAASL